MGKMLSAQRRTASSCLSLTIVDAMMEAAYECCDAYHRTHDDEMLGKAAIFLERASCGMRNWKSGSEAYAHVLVSKRDCKAAEAIDDMRMQLTALMRDKDHRRCGDVWAIQGAIVRYMVERFPWEKMGIPTYNNEKGEQR